MTNRIALITGGAGHIGQAVARKLAGNKVDVVLLDKDREQAARACSSITEEYQVNADFIPCDLSSPDAFSQVCETVSQQFGRMDFLVNNAAFYDDTPGWGVPFEEEGYEAWEKVMKVNLLAPFFLAQSLSSLLRKSESGAIVNVSSIYGLVGPDHRIYEGLNMTNPAAYAASKGGLIQLSRWLSTVLAPDVRVNTVTPGGIERGQDEQFVSRYEYKTPLGRMATNEDIAGAVAFLLSNDAAYVTGQNLIVDGGWTAW
ncbi:MULTISPECIES: SDR family oxidoreductase [unclassified Thalassospira]|uniref:SDR family oxidoreductase n=1 Tax=unclassified Thalassospira TaxID=2648997 RepID=UPI0007A5AE74|nr:MULTISPECIES: SDR family oxidoreductase [unclassified Thalassospira]KZC99065.1 short-chain dehydrogenase [Thalassospira sp. MCCC 1A02898]ONH88640.1 short-chain dehydrogenase [Thalassospira sp. MCCC 1A02803]